MSGHNDFPEFEMDDGHARTKWMRYGEDSAYTIGLGYGFDMLKCSSGGESKGLAP